MSNSVLFDSCTFTMEAPPEFKSYPNESTTYVSGFNNMVTKKIYASRSDFKSNSCVGCIEPDDENN